MPKVNIRKIAYILEQINHEGGTIAKNPLKRIAGLAVIENPFAGKYVEDIVGFSDDLKPLGMQLSAEMIRRLGGDSKIVEGYGKGSIAGANGELEHAALWHVPGGYSMREMIEASMAIVPSSKKVGAVGVRLDVPITHSNASYVRSHFDAMEVGLNDAPHADELLLALVMTTGARIHSRTGGLDAKNVIGEDGLR